MRLFLAVGLGLILTTAPWNLRAQATGQITLQRVDGRVVLDGYSFEPAWAGVQPFLPLQYEPENGAAPTQKTEFLIAYDDDHLYLALRAYDEGREGIRANTLYRDRLSGDDHFEILVDQFNDNETGIVFTTTPAGLRREAALSNDAAGGGIASGGWINVDFNTYWDVATAVTDSGWFAELRIPFSSLRFQPDEKGRVVMGMTLQRKIARRTERLVWPAMKRSATWAFLKPSLAQEVVMEGIRPRLPTYITPYVLAGQGTRTALPSEALNEYRHVDDGVAEAGADVKVNLSHRATLDLTLNTDFAQVEADDQQINLTRFDLFFPEKRQFFQERSALFDFRTGGFSRLFHSRRIGLTDAGAPVRILGGARYVGRTGAWDLGLLDMQTGSEPGISTENFGVFRARRQVINPYSYAGGMMTSRVNADGAYNLALGLDGVFRLAGDDYLTLQWAQTVDSRLMDLRSDYAPLDGALFTAELDRRRRVGFGYTTSVSWTGRDYNPGVGFIQRRDFTMLDNSMNYTWLHGERSRFIFNQLGLEAFVLRHNGQSRIESADVGPLWEWAAKSGAGGTVLASYLYEFLPVEFRISDDAVVPAGTYHFWKVAVAYHETHTQLVQLRPSFEAGSFYDGNQVTAGLTPIWYVSPHLEFNAGYQYIRVRFPDRGQQMDAHLVRLRIGTALNTRLSTNAFIQYNSARDAASANIRFRYNLREGNDFWIVFNEGLNMDRFRLDPALPVMDNRSILFKYTHTFGQ